MKDLSSFLQRIVRSLNKDSIYKSAVMEVVEKRTGIKLSPEDISLKEGILSISARPALKNEISLKEEGIKEELRGAYNLPVIRITYK